MPGRLRRFRAGDKLPDMSADDLNAIVEAAELVRSFRVGAGLELDRAGGTLTLRLTPETRPPRGGEITAAVVRTPGPEDSTLWVRGVRYIDLPPEQSRPDCNDGREPTCRYEWTGDDFEAYPDFGRRAEDYAELAYTADGPPTLETRYVRVRYEAGVWLVELPASGGGVRHVIVRAIPGPDANYVTVQDVAPHRPDGTWDGTFTATGSTWPAAVHPYSVAGDYAGLIWPEGEPLGPATPVLMAHSASGAWWVSQYLRFELPALQRGLVFSDCVPQLSA